MNDSQILQLLWDRLEEAIDALNRRFGAGLYRMAMNILSNPPDAEETVQDTWMALWNAIPPQHPDPLTPYVYRTGRNGCRGNDPFRLGGNICKYRYCKRH